MEIRDRGLFRPQRKRQWISSALVVVLVLSLGSVAFASTIEREPSRPPIAEVLQAAATEFTKDATRLIERVRDILANIRLPEIFAIELDWPSPLVASRPNDRGAAQLAATLAVVPASPVEAPALPPPPATTTIIYQTITQPVVERIIQSPVEVAPLQTGVSEASLTARLQELASAVNQRIQNAFIGAAQSARVENLSAITVAGVSGLTDADIPDDLTASNYLPLAGGALTGTLTGTDLTLSGNLTVSGAQTLSGAITIPYLDATSTSATSTFAGGIAIDETGFVYDWQTNRVGIGTTSPAYPLEVSGTIKGTRFVGYGGGDITTNSAVGVDALLNNTSGTQNSAAGATSLYSNTTGGGNTGMGQNTLYSNTTGPNNTAVGGVAMYFNTTGGRNTGIGVLALYNNTIGGQNSGVGYKALFTNSTGSGNTAMGYQALLVASSTQNTALGWNSGSSITTGSYNVVIGGNSGASIATLSNYMLFSDGAGTERFRVDNNGNFGIGTTSPYAKLSVTGTVAATTTLALRPVSGQTANIIDIFNGSGVLSTVLTAAGNLGIGTTSPYAKLSVVGPVAAEYFHATSSAATSTFAGGIVGPSNFVVQSSSGNVGIGNTAPSYKLDVSGFINTDQYSGYKQAGNIILYASTTNNSLAVGALGAATWMIKDSANYGSIALGSGALNTTPISGFSRNTALGFETLNRNSSGGYNTAVGHTALNRNLTGSNNTAIGQSALYGNQTGNYNNAFGAGALTNNITGGSNIGIGTNSLWANSAGVGNIAIGHESSYYNASATSTIIIGFRAAKGTTAYSNQGGTYVGYQSGYSAATGSDYNTLLGYQAGYNITTGANNLVLGSQQTTGTGITTGSGNILLGKGVRYGLDGTASNQLNIGNLLYATGLGSENTLSTGNVGVATTSPWRTLSVTGTVGFDGLTGNFGAGSLCLDANKQVVYNAGSDACLSSLRSTKHDVVALDLDALAAVIALQPVSFVYNDDASSTVRYGFIAEDTEAIDHSLATHDAHGKVSGIDDRAILSVVVKAIKDLWTAVQSYFIRTETLETEVESLRARVTELESRIGVPPTPSPSSPETEPESPQEAQPAEEQEEAATPLTSDESAQAEGIEVSTESAGNEPAADENAETEISAELPEIDAPSIVPDSTDLNPPSDEATAALDEHVEASPSEAATE